MAEERIDKDCQILQEGWGQWKWAEDIFPQLGGAAAADNPFAGISDSSAGVAAGSSSSIVTDGNPYASPSGSGGHSVAGGDGAVTHEVVAAMDGTRPWVLFFAILAFIATGFCAIAGLIYTIGLLRLSILAAFFTLLWSGLYIGIFGYTGYLLLTYSKAASQFVRTKSVPQLEKALTAQKLFWKTVGILTIVVIAITLVMSAIMVFFVMAMVGAAAGAAAGRP